MVNRAGTELGEVFTKTYIDEQVTAEAIAEAKSFFEGARVDDVVVLFVAGHGTHTRARRRSRGHARRAGGTVSRSRFRSTTR